MLCIARMRLYITLCNYQNPIVPRDSRCPLHRVAFCAVARTSALAYFAVGETRKLRATQFKRSAVPTFEASSIWESFSVSAKSSVSFRDEYPALVALEILAVVQVTVRLISHPRYSRNCA